jgi:hypothetical protein
MNQVAVAAVEEEEEKEEGRREGLLRAIPSTRISCVERSSACWANSENMAFRRWWYSSTKKASMLKLHPNREKERKRERESERASERARIGHLTQIVSCACGAGEGEGEAYCSGKQGTTWCTTTSRSSESSAEREMIFCTSSPQSANTWCTRHVAPQNRVGAVQNDEEERWSCVVSFVVCVVCVV